MRTTRASQPITRATRPQTPSRRRYRGADVSMSVIRRYARAVADRFGPEKIILFGSHAYGTPSGGSDVDMLVVMAARNQLDQAIRIDREVPAPFAVDLIVRTPKTLAWRLEAGDTFLKEIVARGKVLYEKAHKRMGAEGRRRLSRSD